LVDVAVAPDGSVFLSDHNQGIWRIIYREKPASDEPAPLIAPPWPALPDNTLDLVKAALQLPQLESERSRWRIEEIRTQLGAEFGQRLSTAVLDAKMPLRERLQALRLLAPDFMDLPAQFLQALAGDTVPELRGQAAWLLGLRSTGQSDPLLSSLLSDGDPFVRRRAAEAYNRSSDAAPVRDLIRRLQDPERSVQYVCMTALAHRPTAHWLELAQQQTDAPTQLRVLTACQIRGEAIPGSTLQSMLDPLLKQQLSPTNELDLLRVLGLYRAQISPVPALLEQVNVFLTNSFPSPDKNIRWEQARLIGEYRSSGAFEELMTALENEADPVTQFHYAQALARLPAGWANNPSRLRRWFEEHQTGWFAQLEGKGRQFPEFWLTVLAEFARHHRNELLQNLGRIDWASQLGNAVLDLVATDGQVDTLTQLYGAQTNIAVRTRIIAALGKVGTAEARQSLIRQYARTTDEYFRGSLINALAQSPADEASTPYLIDGLSSSRANIAVACARALSKGKVPLTAAMADALLNQLAAHPEAANALSAVLAAATWEGTTTPATQPKVHPPWLSSTSGDRASSGRLLEYWKDWYTSQFGRSFERATTPELKNDAAISAFLMQASGGRADRGGRIYGQLQCHTCHGGPGANSRLFGPELAGVTRRLKREELVEALVYPSKQVAERFQAVEIELHDGRVLTGFVTEKTTDHLTMATQERIERLPRSSIKEQRAQKASLMPDGLFALATWDDLRDLLAYLDALGTTP
jgi:putative heme-binding domain-containing protein